MYSHVTVGTADLQKAGAFYDQVLATLGIERFYAKGSFVGYRVPGGGRSHFFVTLPFDGKPASVGNGTHVAFMAANRPAVDAFHARALALGGQDEGAPGLRPHYHANYYAAYVRDLDGNKLQAVCHDPA
jgi:catechol 2,3-dioxygenase-like lactoylglutathione lyase family enzyme